MVLVEIPFSNIIELKTSVKLNKGKTIGYMIIPKKFIQKQNFKDREEITIGIICRQGEELTTKIRNFKEQKKSQEQ